MAQLAPAAGDSPGQRLAALAKSARNHGWSATQASFVMSQQGAAVTAPAIVQPVSGQADIDISDPAFDFVRSIKVWHVRYHRVVDSGHDACMIWEQSFELGSYGLQGDYAWSAVTPDAVPSWMDLSLDCGTKLFAVGVEWRDHAGQHGYEVVRY